MASNTKLTQEQNFDLKCLRVGQKDVKIVIEWQTIIAYRILPNTVEFSLSVASPNEKKLRAKVGEYMARSRMDSGQTVKMGRYDFMYMLETFFGIEVKL